MLQGGPASVDLLVMLLDLADFHQAAWLQVPEDSRPEAQSLAGGVFLSESPARAELVRTIRRARAINTCRYMKSPMRLINIL